MSTAARVPRSVLAQVLVRSLLVQSAWNYRTLQGTGMAFALLPLLRFLSRGNGGSLEAALGRHAGTFNAHPYLSAVALGSLARLEAEGAPPAVIQRLRVALGGPLGALGDRLVWADWLPLCSVLAVILAWAGGGPLLVVLAFLLLYNGGHLALRIWGFVTGWRSGSAVAGRLKEADLGGLATRVEGWLAAALGVLVGLILVQPALGPGRPDGVDPWWMVAAWAAVVGGYLAGPRAWRPAAAVTVAVVLGLAVSGWLV